MFFQWGQRKTPFQARQEYQKVGESGGSSRDSDDTSQDALTEKEIQQLWGKTPFWRRHASLIVCNGIVFVIYIAILMVVTSRVPQQCRKGPNLIHSPAFEAIEWEEYTYIDNSQSHGPFSGYPRPEIDQNWEKLINRRYISYLA